VNRKLFVILSALLALALILTACAPAAQKITVATDATFKPFEYTDDNGNLVGFDIDLMNEIAKKADLQIEWVNIPFESLLSGLATCQYDMAIAGISIDPERQKQMLFSDPYMDAGLVVVVQKNNTTINSKDDLKGLKVSAQLGTTGEIEAKKSKVSLTNLTIRSIWHSSTLPTVKLTRSSPIIPWRLDSSPPTPINSRPPARCSTASSTALPCANPKLICKQR